MAHAHFTQAYALDVSELTSDHPACVLFFSLSDGTERARVCIGRGRDAAAAWKNGVVQCQSLSKRENLKVTWLRIDWVTAVFPETWSALEAGMSKAKRNYFRYGISFDAQFTQALLEQELNANAMLYVGGDESQARRNDKNFRTYLKRRFGEGFTPDFTPDRMVWRFSTEGIFVSSDVSLKQLPQGRVRDVQFLASPSLQAQAQWNDPRTLNSGRRTVERLDADSVHALIESSSEFLGRQVLKEGRFIYGHFPCFGRHIAAYNALRHASTIYSMLEAWELTQSAPLLKAIKNALAYLANTLIRRYPQQDGTELAFNVDEGGEIKLGANAVSLLALVKYDELTGDQSYRALMTALASGIARMQDPATGRFVHVLEADDLSVKEEFRIIYYDGEAAFGLMRLYGLVRDDRWLSIVEKAFSFFIENKHWRAHDHWLSYCANELTRYRPEEKYFEFGVQNVSGHLDFILDRETTYPTLLELSMAFAQMLQRIDQMPNMRHVLDGLDIDKFYRAMHHRAHYLLNGFFWPEMAMFFSKPSTVVGSFFIRHHSFRVRIDDVEHYLSGYVAYWKFLKNSPSASETVAGVSTDTDSEPESQARSESPSPLSEPSPSALPPPVISWGGDVNLGRRQHYRTAELGVNQVLQIPALSDADLSIVNLECVVSTLGQQGVPKGEGGPYYYRARPEMLRVLLTAGINIVTVANNHSGDYGPEALLQQAQWLDSVGIAHAGSGIDRRDAFEPVLRRAGNLNVAVFSIDTTQPEFAAGADRPGAAFLPLDQLDRWEAELLPRIQAARARAQIVLVAVHWGKNFAPGPEPAERVLGRWLIDAGADAVLGASAHVLQGIEVHAGRPVIHDAGDLLFDALRRDTDMGGIFCLELCEHGVSRIVFVPVKIGFACSVQAHGEQARAITQSYAERCQQLGSTLRVAPDGTACLDLNPPARPAVAAVVPAPRPRSDDSSLSLLPAFEPGSPCLPVRIPEAAHMEPVQMGPLKLLGMHVSPERLSSRQMLWVETYWCCRETVSEDLRIDLRAVPQQASSMQPWGRQMDHDPCDWMIPTSRWQPGVIYRDYYGIRPPYLNEWRNVDLRVKVSILSGGRPVSSFLSPAVIELRIPGKGEIEFPESNLVQSTPLDASEIVKKTSHEGGGEPSEGGYRTEFPEGIRHSKPGQTWTAEQLEAVTGGRWLVRPPEGWFVKSIVVGPKHLSVLDRPALLVAHASTDRMRHEQYSVAGNFWDIHERLSKYIPELSGLIVSRKPDGVPADMPMLQVGDPIRAAIELGLAARSRFTGDVIAVTGTVGKSSTVSMIKALYGRDKNILTTFDNYNSRVGVPVVLSNLAEDHDAAIIEVAQSGLWMSSGPVTSLVRPSVSVITEVALSQTNSRVKSLADVAKWKSRVFIGLTGRSIAVIGDHLPCFDYIHEQAGKHAKRVIVFGRGADREVRILSESMDSHGSDVCIQLEGNRLDFRVPVPGPGMINNAVAAISAFYGMGMSLDHIAESLMGMDSNEGRMQISLVEISGKKFQLIDDSYNAEVASMLNAFSVLRSATSEDGGRKIAVLGRIVHLGSMAKELHEQLAQPLLDSGVSHVITHGDEMMFLRDVLPDDVLGPHFDSAERLVDYLLGNIKNNDVVMLKGSRRNSDFGRIGQILKNKPS